jgi:hypothetical protein
MICLLLDQEGESYTIVRTRDESLIRAADIVLDVGGIFDPGDGVQTITTGKRGEFSVTLPAGRMDLIIEKDGYTSTSLNTEVLRGMAITQPVAIEPVNPSAWYKARLKLLGCYKYQYIELHLFSIMLFYLH